MINCKIISFILLLFIISTVRVHGQQEQNKWNWSAYVDTYYAYDFDKPIDRNRQFSNMAARHNEFNINHAYLLSEYNTENIRATLGLQTGTYADFNYGAEPNELYKMIYQAYAGVKLSDKIWVDAGVFPGHTGYEAVESLYNEIYTRALSTEYTPYYETGVRITIDPSDQWTITGVILNGWQNIAETNDSKAFGVNINFRPNSKLVLNYGNYFGDEGSQFVGSRSVSYTHLTLPTKRIV